MKIADMLNPENNMSASVMSSPPLSPTSTTMTSQVMNHGKPRSRFSDLEDAIICEGVAKGLTWGQISGQLPHRKRATCFNRYRTLQGIRKSRKREHHQRQQHHRFAPPSPHSPHSNKSSIFTPSPVSSPWLPNTPPPSSPTGFLPSPSQVLCDDMLARRSSFHTTLPPLMHTYPAKLISSFQH